MNSQDWSVQAAEVVAELYARIPESQPRPRLEPTRLATEYLGYPQKNYGVIHITGTNGKTTTARIIERILRELGIRTGRLTSPHLISVNERISIDGEPVSDEVLVLAYREAGPLLELADELLRSKGEAPLTFFEAFTALAFQIFSDAPVEVLVLEVGMGGEWDSTNVADADVAVFTAIDLDHQKSLGATVREIAATKAGIIKEKSIVVSSPQQPEAAAEILARANPERHWVSGETFGFHDAKVDGGGTRFSVRGLATDYPQLWMPILGGHQAENAATAIAAVEAFLGAATQPLNDEVLRVALADTTSPGRMQVISREPLVVLDGAHNPAGARALGVAWGEYLSAPKTVGLLGMLEDKNVVDTVRELSGIFESFVVSQPHSPRAMPAAELAQVVERELGLQVFVEPELERAWARAREIAHSTQSALLVTGSLYLTGNVLAMVQAEAERELEAEDYETD